MSLEGQQLGRYQLIRHIGSGGMGEVYLANDPSINRQVAIKVIQTDDAAYPAYKGSTGATRPFQREARAIAMLDHPCILSLYDYGEQPLQGVTVAYLVMPYRPEGSLADWLQQQRNTSLLTLGDVEHIVHEAASALQYAHDHQLIHQDVKPSNFLLRNNPETPQQPELLLTDFGVAKLNTLTSGSSQSIRGTPTAMAPEQWEGHPVAATDQYALAIMAYEMLTGHPPFQGSPMQMMYAHVHMQPPPPSSLDSRLPPAVDAVLLQALAKKHADRFPSISAFASAFQQALQGIDPTMPVLVKPPDIATSTFVQTPSTSGSDLYATLAISEQEAEHGTQRVLTLPGGRCIPVSIPAGVQDGASQIIDLSEPVIATDGVTQARRLHLTLSVVPTVRDTDPPVPFNTQPTVARDEGNLATVLSTPTGVDQGATRSTQDKRPTVANTPISAGRNSGTFSNPLTPPIASNTPPQYMQAAPYTRQATSTLTEHRRASSTGKVLALISAVLLLLLASTGLALFYYPAAIGGSPKQNVDTHATLTAQATHNATITPQANATGTAYSNGTATARANETPTTPVNATATTTAQATPNANPYPPYSGTLTLNDPLSSNNSDNWQVYSDTIGNSCQFTNGAYHVTDAIHYGGPCFAQNTDFSNFTYQVQMTIVKAGQSFSGGGIVFRATGNKYYYFEIFESGKYVFGTCVGNDCSTALAQDLSNPIPSFHTGLGQANTLAVVAQNNSFDLYVNGQRAVGPISDKAATSSHGMIGVYGEGSQAITEVVYSNAKVWV